MTGFEPRTSGIGSDRSTNWATTTAPQKAGVCVFLSDQSKSRKVTLNVLNPKGNSWASVRLSLSHGHDFLEVSGNKRYHRAAKFDLTMFGNSYVLNLYFRFKTWTNLKCRLHTCQHSWDETSRRSRKQWIPLTNLNWLSLPQVNSIQYWDLFRRVRLKPLSSYQSTVIVLIRHF